MNEIKSKENDLFSISSTLNLKINKSNADLNQIKMNSYFYEMKQNLKKKWNHF